jgi:hypothetical protein
MYQQFISHFPDDVKNALEDEGIKIEALQLSKVQKVNESYDAITVVIPNNNLSPIINVGDFYRLHRQGVSHSKLKKMVAEVVKRSLENSLSLDTEALNNYEKVKPYLYVEAMSAKSNFDLMRKIPHRRMEDIASVYRIDLEAFGIKGATTRVSYQMLTKFGVSIEQLHKDAVENTSKNRPVVLEGLLETMYKMTSHKDIDPYGLNKPKNENAYVATVQGLEKGACVMFYESFFEQAAEKLEGDFYVIPSSIHELVLVKDNGAHGANELLNLVKWNNENKVDPCERLTDNVYHYDSKNHIFEQADKFKPRSKMISSFKKGAKTCMLKDLKEKQEVVDQRSGKAKDAVSRLRGRDAL